MSFYAPFACGDDGDDVARSAFVREEDVSARVAHRSDTSFRAAMRLFRFGDAAPLTPPPLVNGTTASFILLCCRCQFITFKTEFSLEMRRIPFDLDQFLSTYTYTHSVST